MPPSESENFIENDKKSEEIKKWFSDQKISSFYKHIFAENFYRGSDALIQTVGLGSLKPNTVLMGFKHNWREDNYINVKNYIDTIQKAFKCRYGVGILRLPDSIRDSKDFTFSNNFTSPKKSSGSSKKKRIDVWWLVDDGGLCILVAHLMQKQKAFKDAEIRIFTGVNQKGDVDHKQRKMKTLMEKFRISFESIHIIKELGQHPSEAIKKAYLAGIKDFTSDFTGILTMNHNENNNNNNNENSNAQNKTNNLQNNNNNNNNEQSAATLGTIEGNNFETGAPNDGEHLIDGALFKRGDIHQEKTKTWRQLKHNEVIREYSVKGKKNTHGKEAEYWSWWVKIRAFTF